MPRFNVKWTVEHIDPEFANKTDEELEEMRTFYFDRWNWETGDPEDRRLFEAIDNEIERRKTNFYGSDIEQELIDALSKEITEEIDREILENLLKKG